MRYVAAKSAEEASNFLLQETGVSRVLAGGTDVLVQMKSGMIEPDLIVDIKKIPGIRNITELDGFFRIGAAVSGSEVKDHENINKMLPGVVEALDLIGSTQIQGRCTMVGNLCNASPAADSVPALVAVNAKVNIIGPQGERSCNVEEIPIAPGKTSLKKGEFIVSVDIPYRPEFSSDAYLRFTPRTEMDIAVVGCAVNVTMDGDKCVDARVALGAVAPTALLVEEASVLLIGSSFEEDLVEKAAQACENACNPIEDKRGTVSYRKKVSKVLFKRALDKAIERAKRG